MDSLPADKRDEWWSADGSEYRFSDLGELIDNYDELKPGDVVYVGEAVRCDPAWLYDADDLIEALGDRASSEYGEYADDWPDVAREAREEFNTFLLQWINKHCPPTFFGITNERPYTITAEDVQP